MVKEAATMRRCRPQWKSTTMHAKRPKERVRKLGILFAGVLCLILHSAVIVCRRTSVDDQIKFASAWYQHLLTVETRCGLRSSSFSIAIAEETSECPTVSTETSVAKGTELVSVLVPVYSGASTIGNLLDDIRVQSYRPLEILISLDESPDSKESESVVQHFMRSYPELNVQVFRQKDRLHFANNMNFLLSKAKGGYVSIIPHDDSIPPDYIAKLADCLDKDAQAVNCYPRIKTVQAGDMHDRNLEEEIRQPNITGTQIQRIDTTLAYINVAASLRGLVRRPSHGSMSPYFVPRLYKNFYLADLVQVLLHAAAGNVKEVDVDYKKIFYPDSVHNQMLLNRSVFSVEDFVRGALEVCEWMYNNGHPYASSSKSAYKELLVKFLYHSSYADSQVSGDEDTQRLVEKREEAFKNRIQRTRRVAILGGGIQGCLMALMFRKNGYDVTIYDKSDDIMNRASAVGEGKIHLGLVYNKDQTMKTGEHMLHSALRFSSYIDYLVGNPIDWTSLKSDRFNYMIPYSSLVTPTEFEEFAAKLEDKYEDILSEDPALSYLGLRPPKLIERKPNLHPGVNASFIQAQYISAEYAISTRKLKSIIKRALVDQSIKVVFGRKVVEVTRNTKDKSRGKMRVVTDVSNHDFDVVVNCMWEGRSTIDKKMGVEFSSGGNYRFKVSIKFPFMEEFASLPSVTLVNGEYGDFVQYSREDGMYFSYYPVARLGMSTNDTEMMKWDRLADGIFPDEMKEYQLEAHQQAFRMYFPAYDIPFKCPRVSGGYILGNGATDILDESTMLHERSDFPFVIDDNYITVSTQKFTSSPYNAWLLEQKLFRNHELPRK